MTLPKYQCPYFTPWIDIYRAWNMILQDQLQDAYNLLYHSKETSAPQQAFSMQFVLAIADCMGGRYSNAEEILKKAPAFFQDVQDHAQACSARFHLANLYLQTERSGQARVQVQCLCHCSLTPAPHSGASLC